MNEAQSATLVVRFGTFEVNLHSRELRKRGMRIRLEEKPFRILEMLLERAGHVVTRRTLRERLWPDTNVGFEHGLNTAVNKLRDLLGDSARSPRFVETLPRLGYRFIAPVVMPENAIAAAAKKMLLVLPFENVGGDREQECFADGLTEEMISQLGQLNPKRLGVSCPSCEIITSVNPSAKHSCSLSPPKFSKGRTRSIFLAAAAVAFSGMTTGAMKR